MHHLSRRDVLSCALAAATVRAQSSPLKLCIFSKHLQWLPIGDAAAIAAGIGFDGVDITVRDGGHVAPQRVEDELPIAVAAVRKSGLEVPMITTGIVDAATPHAASVLRVAAALGIRRYRWGGFKYHPDRPIPQQLADFTNRARELAALNKEYGVCAMYHTHSGVGEVGASIWDLYMILEPLDRNAVAINYDIGHATIEGGLGGWIDTTRLTLPMMRGIALKDFAWVKDADGKWQPQWRPLGEGMVHFPQFLEMVRKGGFNGPVQMHFEYAGLGGAEHGHPKITITRQEFIEKTQRDVRRARALLREARLS